MVCIQSWSLGLRVKAWILVQAKDFYTEFLERLRKEYVADRVKDGIFGAMMDVLLINDV